jgi:hypothetical protein
MEEALNAIGANRECPTDELLAFQVRSQLLAQRAVQARQQEGIDLSRIGAASSTASISAGALLYFRSLQAQLHQLQASLCPRLQQNGK